jgi:hypothetical protein
MEDGSRLFLTGWFLLLMLLGAFDSWRRVSWALACHLLLLIAALAL